MRSAAHTSAASDAPKRRPRNTVTDVRLGSFALSRSTQDATPTVLPHAIAARAGGGGGGGTNDTRGRREARFRRDAHVSIVGRDEIAFDRARRAPLASASPRTRARVHRVRAGAPRARGR